MVIHSPPTSEVGGSNPGPYLRKLVFACRWSSVQYPEQLYVLVSSAHKTTYHNMTCIVLEAT